MFISHFPPPTTKRKVFLFFLFNFAIFDELYCFTVFGVGGGKLECMYYVYIILREIQCLCCIVR